jgi:plasmid stabilization system protein ParE
MLEREREEIGETPQAGVLGERCQHRLCLGELVCERRKVVQRQVEQGVARKERLARRISDGAEVVARAQRIGERPRGPLHPLGTMALDHGDHRVLKRGKCLVEVPLVATKRHVRRDHLGRARVDPQMLHGERERSRGEQQRAQNER